MSGIVEAKKPNRYQQWSADEREKNATPLVSYTTAREIVEQLFEIFPNKPKFTVERVVIEGLLSGCDKSPKLNRAAIVYATDNGCDISTMRQYPRVNDALKAAFKAGAKWQEKNGAEVPFAAAL